MYDTEHPDTEPSLAVAYFREQARAAAKELEETHGTAVMLLAGHLSTFLKPGDVVERADGRDLTLMLRTHVGHAHGATRFELLEEPSVALNAGRDHIEAAWYARAQPLRADGKRMKCEPVVVQAPMFPMPDPSDLLQGEAYRAFCDAFVDNWMRSTPENYKRLKPSAQEGLKP